MRLSLISAVSVAAAMFAGCQMEMVDELGETQQASIGGTIATGQPHYEAVAAVYIKRPERDPGTTTLRDDSFCSGVLIADKLVLTSATCVYDNWDAEESDDYKERREEGGQQYLDPESIYVQFGSSVGDTTEYALDAAFVNTPSTRKGLTLHRYYDDESQARNDFALLHLAQSPGITPATVYADKLPSDFDGTEVEFVGYGFADNTEGHEGRKFIKVPARSVVAERFQAGVEETASCAADGGGPGFVDFGEGPVVVDVTERLGNCDRNAARLRVDVVYDEFIAPYLDYQACTEADDCGTTCDLDGTCVEDDCSTRDWDCDLKVFPGLACGVDSDCEQGGACVAATDDPSFSYCDRPCTTDGVACPSGMTCSDDRCIYDGISPGSQGAVCSNAGDCRSNICEFGFCAYECDPGDPATCSGEDFFCLPASDDPSLNVCRKDLASGGVGFCHVGSDGRQSRTALLSCLGLLFVLGAFRRRRA